MAEEKKEKEKEKPLTPEQIDDLLNAEPTAADRIKMEQLKLLLGKPAGHASLEGESKPVALATPAASKGHEKEHGGIA